MGRKSRDEEFIEMLFEKFPWIDKIEPFVRGKWQIWYYTLHKSKISPKEKSEKYFRPLMEFLKEHGYDFSCGSSGNDIIFWKKKK
jgi:hypothetical protein